jgi:hypothetical protein
LTSLLVAARAVSPASLRLPACTFLPFREIFGFGNLVGVIDTCRTSEESFR